MKRSHGMMTALFGTLTVSSLAQTSTPASTPPTSLPTPTPATAPAAVTPPADGVPASGPEAIVPLTPEQEAMAKLAATGDNHAFLVKAAGEWTTKSKVWPEPDASPLESEGRAQIRSMLGGRFAQLQFIGEIAGAPFRGFAVYGYNNAKKTFEVMWIDNMNTGMVLGTGTLSDDKKTLTWSMEMPTIDGTSEKVRAVETWTDDRTMTYTLYRPTPRKDDAADAEYKSMEIAYTKLAEPPTPSAPRNAAPTGAPTPGRPAARPRPNAIPTPGGTPAGTSPVKAPEPAPATPPAESPK